MLEDMTIPAYDVEVLRNSEAEKKRRHERTVKRWETFGIVGGFAVFGAVIVALVYIWWQAMAGPSAAEQRQKEVQIVCTERGGTWLDVSQPDSAEEGACFGSLISTKD